MRRLVSKLTFAILLGASVSIACGDDDDSSDGHGGSAGKSGVGGNKASGGIGGKAAGGSGGGVTTGGTAPGAGGTAPGTGGTTPGTGGRTPTGGAGNGGTASGGAAHGGTTPIGGEAGSGGEFGGAGSGAGGAGGSGGAIGEAGAGGEGTRVLIARGEYLVNAVAQCGGCHTNSATPTAVLGGNPNFKSGGNPLPAPNLTPDATGLGSWTDAQIKNAFMNGIDDEGRQLSPAMPYWLFHNLTPADADAIVAYLRSLPKVVNAIAANPAATAVTPLAASAFPDTTLAAGADHDAAVQGKYLLTSAARCVSCHSVVTGGVPAPAFSGRAPTTTGSPYPANLTPDATGTAGWTAADVSSVLLTSMMKGTTNPVCSMPRFQSLTSADALAIGHYLTSIPPVANANASLANLPVLTTCP